MLFLPDPPLPHHPTPHVSILRRLPSRRFSAHVAFSSATVSVTDSSTFNTLPPHIPPQHPRPDFHPPPSSFSPHAALCSKQSGRRFRALRTHSEKPPHFASKSTEVRIKKCGTFGVKMPHFFSGSSDARISLVRTTIPQRLHTAKGMRQSGFPTMGKRMRKKRE